MKKQNIFIFLFSLIATYTFSQSIYREKLNNPVVVIYDGCVERFMGYYYAMGTGTAGKIYNSKNLITWNGPTLAAETNEATWLNDSQWTQAYTYNRVGAGDILYRNGVFHIYFNGIGHSYSDKPLGMYKEHSIFEPFDDYGIDAQVFQDDDGEIYYLKKVNPGDPHPINGGNYGKNGAKIWTFHLSSPFVRKNIPGSEQMTHQPGHPTNVDWENFEGPELFKYRDNYYLMYSPNRMSARTGMYLVGAAQSDEPMNFSNAKKYPHPILTRNMEDHLIKYKQILNSGEHGGWNAKYLTSAPGGDWVSLNYDDSQWMNGTGGFGLKDMDIARVRSNRTIWNTNQIYIRRKFSLDRVPEKIALKYRLEANVDFYINGNKLTINKSSAAYSLENINPEWFNEGENIIAVEAINNCSGSDCFKFIDFGLFDTNGQDAEKIVIGQSQANYVVAPNGFERWIMYKAFFNGTSAQGIDRMHFYNKELVVESTSTFNTPGYHPVPSMPTFISYFDYADYYPYSPINDSKWKISAGILKVEEDNVSELLFRHDAMTNYRFEVPFRIPENGLDYAAAYAYYSDDENWMKIKILRDEKKWEYEIRQDGISTVVEQNLPEKFEFLEQEPLVAHYDTPWHTLIIYKNGSKFRVELDYFSLTRENLIETEFAGSGKIGLIASSGNVNFDAIQYTNGWDEWDKNINGWETHDGEWKITENGLQQTNESATATTIKGDNNWDYEFSAYMKNDRIPENGKAGFYPLYIDDNNYVRAAIDYSSGKLEIVKKEDGIVTETQYLDVNKMTSRQYTFDNYPTVSYRYDFRCETELSGVELLWFEENYPYLSQTFDLPRDVKFYALTGENSWQPLNGQSYDDLKFASLNSFSFDNVKTKAIKIELTPQSGKAVRAFSAYFHEDLASDYYFRCRREYDNLHIFLNDSLKVSLKVTTDKSKVGLYSESTTPTFNGMLYYQTGKIGVKKINIPEIKCEINESIPLKATVEPANATIQNLVWISSNPEIASIDENNILTRHAHGEVTLTAWSADGGLSRATTIIGNSSDIEQKQQPNVIIYPNPVNHQLSISSSIPINKVELFTSPGKKIKELKTKDDEIKLDMSEIPSGLYILSVHTNEKIISTIIIKN